MKNFSISLLTLISLFIFGCSDSTKPTTDDPDGDLNSVIQSVGNYFSSIETSIQNDVQFAIQNGIDSVAVRAKLKQFLLNNKHVEEYAFINSKSILQIIEPPKYASFEGTDMSDDVDLKATIASQEMKYTKVFSAYEGYEGAAVAAPIYKNDQFLGAFDCVFKPDVILRDIITKKTCEMWVMEKGGRQLYDYDSTEIGNNILTGQFTKDNPKLLAAVNLIDSTESGSSNYEFIDEHTNLLVKKNCYWKTYKNKGLEWRFIWVKRVN